MIVLITGISSGFGRAMAAQLSAEGNKVYGTYRHCEDFLPEVEYIKADVTSDKDVESVVKKVIDTEGCIDVFINNAGMGYGGPLEFASIEEARNQMDVNWLGMVRFLHYILPEMRERHSGKIICFSSIGGLMGLPFQGLYSASKFAMEGYCEALRLELKDTGIKVVIIEPGDFCTSFTARRQSSDCPGVHAAYPKYAASLAGIEHDEQTGLKPEYLAKKIARIVKSGHPAYHYVIASPIQKLSVFAKRLLPSRWFAAILGMYYKLN